MQLSIEFNDLGMKVEQPIKFASQKNIMRVIHTTYDQFAGDQY